MTLPALLLGTHEPRWLGRSPLHLFISLERRDRLPRRPRAPAAWSLDSGGYTRLHHGGWTMSAADYLAIVYDLADRHPGLCWAAAQDWMCEPSALAATGLTVAEHQARTVDNYCQLRQLDHRGLIVPVVQGWEPGDHMRCVDLYAAAGVDLTAAPLVGVGSICRRQATDEIAGIVHALAAAGLALHGFGVKAAGLDVYGDALVSADSLAWSYRAREAARHGEPAPGDGCEHRSCANCYRWAHQWHAAIVNRPRQLALAL